MNTDMDEQKWTVRELTMQNIQDLDNWGQIIEEAILNARRNKGK
jgi:hypothetical protein